VRLDERLAVSRAMLSISTSLRGSMPRSERTCASVAVRSTNWRAVDGLLADSRGLGDGVDAGAGVSLAQEHAGGGVQDRRVLGR
jgi:hypothetical protein